MGSKKYTIKDVAELAGVSKGTVDRVLHKRGKVSQKALEKVNQVLKELDFKPNPIARSLKNNKVYKIAVLLPDSNVDPYWTGTGLFLKKGTFNPAPIAKSGFYAPHDAKDMQNIKVGDKTVILIANNNDYMQAIEYLK